MKRFLFISSVLMVGILFAITSQVMAGGTTPPPPPPVELDCSPGFYKNHTELWWFDSSTPCCEGPDVCNMLESMLRARGPGSGAVRAWAAGDLNECFEEYGLNPCEDEVKY